MLTFDESPIPNNHCKNGFRIATLAGFMKYPVLEVWPDLRRALETNPLVILQAPPGAGKSTVLPLELAKEPWLKGGRIVMLEPRRLAARAVAMRMSSTLAEEVGETVGYRIRFETKVSGRTVIEVVTEGILARMIQSDPSLEPVKLLIFDEFHERNLHADVALALSRQVQQLMRPDLKILIMSATLEANSISAVFNDAPVIISEGRQYPVTIQYADRELDTPIAVRTASAVQRALRDHEGDVLVFLPGAGEIRQTQEKLEEMNPGISICPLYGDLPFRDQQMAIAPRADGTRKVVLATSIAETSLTIEGIRVVIDSGLSRVPKFDPRSGLTRLETVRVTVDSADQRAGRAGRLGPGVCIRLWTAMTQRNLAPQRTAEIEEADLAPMMLDLFQWGVRNVNELTWVTPPPAGTVSQATQLLIQLEAVDGNGITLRGKQMLQFPTHPRLSHMLLKANGRDEQILAADLAAILEERDPVEKNEGADILLRLELFDRWRAGDKVSANRNLMDRIEKISAQWKSLLRVEGRSKVDTSRLKDASGQVGRLLMAAYPERVARQQQKHGVYYTLSNGRVLKLQSHDPLINDMWLCVAQLDAGTKGEGRIYLAASLQQEDVQSVAVTKDVVSWDEDRQMITAVRERRLGVLLVDHRPLDKVNDEQQTEVWLEVIKKNGISLLGWDDRCRGLQSRMQSLSVWRPDEGWPDVSDEHLLETLAVWLKPFLAGIYKLQELQKLDGSELLLSLLSWEQRQRLDYLVPEKLAVPSGSMIGLKYTSNGSAPVMEVRLQEVFGLLDTPAVNEGRNKVILHLLSPGYKPVQVTQDLRSFWQTTYHEVRKELRRRYPKHSWPEDPWTAEAVRGVRRPRP